jgi:early secretory antigenic target protein ESAT-6
MSEVSVNFGAMQTGVSDIQARYNAIQSKLDDLKAYLEPMRATWTGSARESYDAKQREWDQSATDLQAILNSIGQALNGAHDDFHAGESRNTSMWGG